LVTHTKKLSGHTLEPYPITTSIMCTCVNLVMQTKVTLQVK